MDLRRDPQARGYYLRWTLAQLRTPDSKRRCCGWCGNAPNRLYSYEWVWEGASVPAQPDSQAWWFCNHTCFQRYFA